MALQSFQLDPNVTALTDNDIIDKINAASIDITRAGSVDPSARPIETDEVTSTEILNGSVTGTDMSATAAKDNLNAMSNPNRGFIRTSPVSGEFPIIECQRDSSGNLDVTFDDVAIP
jgi:hypothetical protein